MAKAKVEIDVKVDDSQAKGKLKGLGDDAEKAGSKFGGLGSSAGILKAGLAGLVGTEVIGFLKDATINAAEDAAAQEQLALAVQNATTATDAEVVAVGEWIDKTSRATGITDDQLRPALANLVRATGEVEQAQTLMGTAMDIATARGLPLEQVSLALTKGFQGNIGALGRLGLKVRDSAGDYLTFEEAIAEANRTMGGATQTAAEGAEGSVKRLQIAFDETKEELGAAFIPMLITAADAIVRFMDQMEKPVDLESMDSFTRSVADSDDGVIDISRSLEGLGRSFEALGDLLGITVEPVLGETYDVLSSLQPNIRDVELAADDLAEAQQAVADSTRGSTDAFYEHQDAIRAATDPVFALADAERDQADAIADAVAAAEEYGEGSPQHLDALGKVRDAAYEVKDAEREMGNQSGVTRATMETNLRALGVYTEEQIQLMLDDFDRINAYTFQAKNIQVTHTVTGGGPQEYQTGGMVPGLPGQAFPAVLHGGEQVIPAHQVNGRARGTTNHITINAGMGSDPNAISRAVVEALQRYQRTNGTVPIRTRA